MQKRKALIALIAVAAITAHLFSLSNADAQHVKKIKPKPKAAIGTTKMYGAGGIIGDPIGVNAKYWQKESLIGFQGLAGYDSTDDALALSADALYHFKDVADFDFPWDYGKLTLYAGLGGKLSFPTNTRFTIRIPFGVNAIYAGQDFDIFAELVPGVRLAPEAGGNFDWGIGARYYW